MSSIKLCSGDQYSLECLSNYLSIITCSLNISDESLGSESSYWLHFRAKEEWEYSNESQSHVNQSNHKYTVKHSRACYSLKYWWYRICFSVENITARWGGANSHYYVSWIYHRVCFSPIRTATKSHSIPVTMATTSPSSIGTSCLMNIVRASMSGTRAHSVHSSSLVFVCVCVWRLVNMTLWGCLQRWQYLKILVLVGKSFGPMHEEK